MKSSMYTKPRALVGSHKEQLLRMTKVPTLMGKVIPEGLAEIPEALDRSRAEVFGNDVMSSCCKITAASDGASLCDREGALLLWHGKMSATLL